jgi:hypothetical protein
MSKSKLVLEYENVTKELQNIRNKIVALKDITETKIKTAKTEDEKSSIFIDFKGKVDKIQQDKNTKKKYKQLQKRKLEIETEISNVDNFISETNNILTDYSESKQQSYIIMDDINVLIKKYKKNINIPIYSRTTQLINKIKNNDYDNNLQIKKLDKMIKKLNDC